MITEWLNDGHQWLRIAERDWEDPLDPTYAQHAGGRWNPPQSWRTLYLNEDVGTARSNLRNFIANWPYEPEDLRGDTGPDLAVATLPRRQRVVDAHTPNGIAELSLPSTYPLDGAGNTVSRNPCQQVGVRVHDAGLRGVHCRSAQSTDGAGRELAWFPAPGRNRATLIDRIGLDDWYWT